MPKARCHTQPGLLADFHDNPVLDTLKIDGQRRMTARWRARACRDLDCHLVFVSKDLGKHVTAIKFCHKCMGNIMWLDISVKNSSFHVFDYNPVSDDDLSSCFMSLKIIYAMKQFWFKPFLGILVIVILGAGAFLSTKRAVAYQDVATPTGIFVTVTYTDPINVRSGPSTILYPIVAQLNPGEVVPALGISPKREWIQVSYPGGTGWVYASFVSISGGELGIVEPPPTPTQVIATIDPTLAAMFTIQPTLTRLPTFTPPPPLEVVDMTPTASTPRTVAPGIFIAVLGLLGGLGLILSFLLRR